MAEDRTLMHYLFLLTSDPLHVYDRVNFIYGRRHAKIIPGISLYPTVLKFFCIFSPAFETRSMTGSKGGGLIHEKSSVQRPAVITVLFLPLNSSTHVIHALCLNVWIISLCLLWITPRLPMKDPRALVLMILPNGSTRF